MTGRRGNPHVQCSICLHQERPRIDLALVSGAAARAVGRKFNVSPHALGRHLRAHVSPERRAQLVAGPLKLAQLAERAAEEGMSLLDYLGLVRSSLMHQFLACAEAGDRQGAALLSGRLLECLRMVAQISGELTTATATVTNNTVNVFASDPDFRRFQDSLIRALSRFPEAYAAVLAEFERLEAVPAELPALEHKPDVEHVKDAAAV